MVTVAFASLTGVIYYLWWDKPLDIRCSIPVHLIDGRCGKIEGDIEKEETSPQIISSSKTFAKEIPENVVVNPSPLSITSNQVDTSTPDPAPTQMQQFRAFRHSACEEYGTLFGLGYIFIGFPLTQFIRALSDMPDCRKLGDKSLRVPTFYSPYNGDDPKDYIPLTLAMCVATVFGAIHCIPWSFHFATLQERWVWRISAILVSGMPIFVVALVFLPLPDKENKPTWMKVWTIFVNSIFTGMNSLYIIARIVLLVLPFVALRALSPGAYGQVNWVSLLPHI
jgi:hypothetical protein